MNRDPENQPSAHGLSPLDVATRRKLQNLLLDEPGVTDYLQQVAVLAAVLVPGSSCGVTMRREHRVATVASSDNLARQLDEVQYGHGRGPCLQSLHTDRRVEVAHVATDDRWGDYPILARAVGIGSSLSVPLTAVDTTLGALNLYSREEDSYDESRIRRVESFAQDAGTTLTLILRQTERAAVEAQLRDALATRPVIDQALGILMFEHRISSADAIVVLRKASRDSNRKLSEVAAELIRTLTGHPFQQAPPFTKRG